MGGTPSAGINIQYKFTTRLTLSSFERRDEGTYYCVSKNEMGITRGNIQVFKRDPNRPPPPKTSGKLEFEYFGDRAPELLGFEDICPGEWKDVGLQHFSKIKDLYLEGIFQ